jgi:hypothetical protein
MVSIAEDAVKVLVPATARITRDSSAGGSLVAAARTGLRSRMESPHDREIGEIRRS